jgi:hypothetical protein
MHVIFNSNYRKPTLLFLNVPLKCFCDILTVLKDGFEIWCIVSTGDDVVLLTESRPFIPPTKQPPPR